MDVSAIVLAAGKGTRMKSDLPKCAHTIIDKPMVEYVVDALKKISIEEVVTVVGYRKEIIEKILETKSHFAVQNEQLGTAHAVKMAEGYFDGKDGVTIIAIGDMPFITPETYYQLLTTHLQSSAVVTVLTTEHPNPYGYGRIVRNEEDEILAIVEENDCDKNQRNIMEINASVYAVQTNILFKLIDLIDNENTQHEYYLTDIIKVARKQGMKVSGYKVSDYNEISGVNDKLQLMKMESEMQDRILKKHLLKGVTIRNAQSVVVGVDVKLRPGCELSPGAVVVGKSIVEENAVIGPFTEIRDSRVGEGSRVFFSYINNSVISPNSVIGPYVSMNNNEIQMKGLSEED